MGVSGSKASYYKKTGLSLMSPVFHLTYIY